MSAGITLEPVTIEQPGMYMAGDGRIYCVDCVASDRVEEGKIEQFLRSPEALAPEDRCELCRRAVEECAPRIVEGYAWVEHVPCKIF